jgi:hypothetical protein
VSGERGGDFCGGGLPEEAMSHRRHYEDERSPLYGKALELVLGGVFILLGD